MTVFAKPLIQAKYASSTLAAEYTTGPAARTIIDKFTASNQNGSTQTLDIHIIPSGGVADSSNRVVSALSIAAGVSVDVTQMKNEILSAGDSIHAKASIAAMVVIRMSGREIT